MKSVQTGPGGHNLQDIFKRKKVSRETISRLNDFMEQIDKRLSSQGISHRVHTHERGLTYFPSDKDRPKAFWVTLVVSPSGKSLLIDSGKMVRDLA